MLGRRRPMLGRFRAISADVGDARQFWGRDRPISGELGDAGKFGGGAVSTNWLNEFGRVGGVFGQCLAISAKLGVAGSCSQTSSRSATIGLSSAAAFTSFVPKWSLGVGFWADLAHFTDIALVLPGKRLIPVPCKSQTSVEPVLDCYQCCTSVCLSGTGTAHARYWRSPGRLRLTACNFPSATVRLRLSTCYWPPTTSRLLGRLLLAADACSWTLALGRLLLAACFGPPTSGSLVPAAIQVPVLR